MVGSDGVASQDWVGQQVQERQSPTSSYQAVCCSDNARNETGIVYKSPANQGQDHLVTEEADCVTIEACPPKSANSLVFKESVWCDGLGCFSTWSGQVFKTSVPTSHTPFGVPAIWVYLGVPCGKCWLFQRRVCDELGPRSTPQACTFPNQWGSTVSFIICGNLGFHGQDTLLVSEFELLAVGVCFLLGNELLEECFRMEAWITEWS